MRTLIHFPIIHHPVEMLAPDNYEALCQICPGAVWKFDQCYDSLWEDIDSVIAGKEIQRVYQDSFSGGTTPYLERVKRLAQAGSRNAKRVCDLMERGAQLMPTENSFLVDLHIKLGAENSFCRALRDREIARRIEATLEEGETGVLFLGSAHNITERLHPDANIKIDTYDAGFDRLMYASGALMQIGRDIQKNKE